MKKNAFLSSGLVTAFLLFFSILHANQLDGLWRNDRQNITLRIEQDEDGFRAKRIDQSVWYRYSLKSDDVYVDRLGNWYGVLDRDEIEWNEASSNKRIVFSRVDSRDDDAWDHAQNSNDAHDPWDQNRDRWDEDEWNNSRRSAITGRWYDRSTKERLEIESINGGYRVRTQHSAWEKYAADRNGNRLRSTSGNTIQMLDRNTIRWKSYQGRHERIFIRQGNRNNSGHWNDRDHDNRNKHHDKKNCR